MFLHNDKDLFKDVIEATAAYQNRPVAIVEKDYYVTMILKLLANTAPGCVFKGGTSLSKCHHVINRFSEDIDITFSDTLTQGQRKKLKNDVISNISKELGLPISNWEETRSRRDYNCYIFDYESIEGKVEQSLLPGIKMEIVLGSVAFPTVKLPVDSFVYQYLAKENMDIVKEFGLEPFEMTVQSLERTFADKVFAICDYYIAGNVKRHSRHIYDLYMMLPKVSLNDDYKDLVSKIRNHRAQMSICPSAQPGIDITNLLEQIIEKEIYKADYREITTYFQDEPLEYDIAISVLTSIAKSGVFLEGSDK